MRVLGVIVLLAWAGGVRGQMPECSGTQAAYYDFKKHQQHYMSESDNVTTQQIIRLVKEFKEIYGSVVTIPYCNSTDEYAKNITIFSNSSMSVFNDEITSFQFYTISPENTSQHDQIYGFLSYFTLCTCSLDYLGDCTTSPSELTLKPPICSACSYPNCPLWSWKAPAPPNNDDNNNDVVWIVVGSVGSP